MADTFRERRKFKRFDVDMNLNVRSEGKQAVNAQGSMENLSREGMRVMTDTIVAMGTVLDFTMTIPDDPMPITAAGEVVWVSQKQGKQKKNVELGIKFLMMDAMDKFRVLDYAYNTWLSETLDTTSTKK